MMPVKRAIKKPIEVQREHIELRGLGAVSRYRYKRAVWRFLEWRKLAELPKPSKLSHLEYQCCEFINFLYQDERPLYWAGEFLSGMKRYWIQGYRATCTAQRYYNYWVKGTHRTQALPISGELVRGMAFYFCLKTAAYGPGLLVGFSRVVTHG